MMKHIGVQGACLLVATCVIRGGSGGRGNSTVGDQVSNKRPEDSQVGSLGSAESRKLQPQDEKGLESEVPAEVIENEPKSQALDEVEETKDDPVGEPLNVVMG